jgi:hypothetical protein
MAELSNNLTVVCTHPETCIHIFCVGNMTKQSEYNHNTLILYKNIALPSLNKKSDNQHTVWWQTKEPTAHKIRILHNPSQETFLKTRAGFTTVVNQKK